MSVPEAPQWQARLGAQAADVMALGLFLGRLVRVTQDLFYTERQMEDLQKKLAAHLAHLAHLAHRARLAQVARVVPEGADHDLVERGGRAARLSLRFEEDGDRGLRVRRQGVRPAERGQRAVECGTVMICHRPLQALGQQLALDCLHHRSAPRSRSRRAMMLRWISMLPP